MKKGTLKQKQNLKTQQPNMNFTKSEWKKNREREHNKKVITIVLSLAVLFLLIGYFLNVNWRADNTYSKYPESGRSQIPYGLQGIVDPNAPIAYSKTWYTLLFNQGSL